MGGPTETWAAKNQTKPRFCGVEERLKEEKSMYK